MGYYSEVIIVIARKAHDDFLAAITAEVLEKSNANEYDPGDLLADAVKEEHSDAVVYKWPSIKWYEYDDPAVEAVRKALDQLDSDDYMFYRLGEEYGDYETRGSYYGEPVFGVVHKLEQF